MSGERSPGRYRRRGKAEGDLGELMSVVAPALSSTAPSRRKSHDGARRFSRDRRKVKPVSTPSHAAGGSSGRLRLPGTSRGGLAT